MIKAADFGAGTVAHVCDVCGGETSVPMEHLELGGAAGDVIAFPACKCGARETVFRTFAKSFERSRPSARHLAANLLAHRLKSASENAETKIPYGAAELGDLGSFITGDLPRLLAERRPKP